MTPFLQSVARAYARRYGDLSDFCFVFPNKRAGTFFLKRLSAEAESRPILAPKITSIVELAEDLSGRIVDNRIDLLFLLYKSYMHLLATDDVSDKKSDPKVSFDDFRTWGETVLSDFGEVDMYGVNPDEIFKNLKDFREIASNYLTDEQRKVMEEYFGYQPGVEKTAESFWKTFKPDTELKGAFLHLWQTMAPLYHALESELETRGLATPAGSYRLALRNVADGNCELPWEKMVFIGFNALSLVERELFKELQKFEDYDGPCGPEPFVDFFWDGTGPILSPGASQEGPAKFLNLNRRDFPEPKWASDYLHLSDTDTLPESVRIIASPSNSLQAKIVGRELKRLYVSIPKEEFIDARIAVVLPDENLLLPLLYSLPKGFSDVNLTMGYPLRLTSTASFVSLYRTLLHHTHTGDGTPTFYHRDLRRFLAHPFVHAVAGSVQIARLNMWLNKTHRMNPTLAEITAEAPGLSHILKPLPKNATPRQTASNLADTLRAVSGILAGYGDNGVIKSRLDRDHIDVYIDALGRLLSAVEEHGVMMSPTTFFALADRMLAPEQVNFEGEPLSGLQVMGMLETRALDFDRVIIPSANERKLPVKGRTKSFLPNSLRAAYHMPPMQHQENLASYYFYRLISRASEVVIVYDARTGGGFGSEPSRYIMQLEYLLGAGKIKFEEFSFTLAGKRKVVDSIPKNSHTMAILSRYLQENSKYPLSASSLKTYCSCGLRFFFERVMGIRTDNEASEYIDAITQGNIIHEVMMNLYLPKEKQNRLLDHPVVITADMLDNLKKNRRFIHSLVRRSINRGHFNLPESDLARDLPHTAELVADNLTHWIVNILERDKQFAPLEILGCEFGSELRYPISDGRKVNMNFYIDRLDRTAGSDKIRIVDYKTSSLYQKEYNELDPSEMFRMADSRGYSRQVLMYSELLNLERRQKGIEEISPDFALYNVPKILNKKEGVISFRNQNGELLSESEDTAPSFRRAMTDKLEELFNSDVPFSAPYDTEEACKYCPLGILCGR